MYERAATIRGDLNVPTLPIWHLEPGLALFAGPLGRNAPHMHSVPVYLAGLYGAFRLRIGGGAWVTCEAAVVPAGVTYEFDVAGHPLAVLYLEPREAGVDALVPLITQGHEEGSVLIGASEIARLIRDLYEAPGSAPVSGALTDVLAFARPRSRRSLDPRIMRAVASLSALPDVVPLVADAAREAGLSPSRFQHLFAAEVGVSFGRFRVWQRLRGAIAEIVDGASFTSAAHRAGFFDQAHFNRAFRQAFGAAPSPSLRKVRRSG